MGVLLAISSVSRSAAAEEPSRSHGPKPITVDRRTLHSLSFARLIYRTEQWEEIGVVSEDLRFRFIDELRERGYPAVGGENLVFGEDSSDKARFLLGGTVTELECAVTDAAGSTRRCRIGIVWELKDLQSERIVYKVLTRHLAQRARSETRQLGSDLLRGAFHSLLARQRFVEALTKKPDEQAAAQTFPVARFRQCPAAESPMPASSEQVLQGAAVVSTSDGHGSGAFISPDGFVLTAAHVIAPGGAIYVHTRGGEKLPVKVIRVARDHDVALLRVDASGRGSPCLPLRVGEAAIGEDIFAVGAPLDQRLAFTVTRGIVSGFRDVDGATWLQTDASLNAGNSGGPLVDARGQLAGIAQAKALGAGVEGVAFGVPVYHALERLGLAPGAETDVNLLQPALPQSVATPVATVQDQPDPAPDLGARAQGGFPWIPTGLGLAAIGGGGVALSWVMYKNSGGDEAGYDRAAVVNDLSWVAVGVGAALVAYPLVFGGADDGNGGGGRKSASAGPRRPSVSIGIGPASLTVQGSY